MRPYVTSDLYLSAFLKAKGMKLLDTQKAANKTSFVFDDNPKRKLLIQEYFNDGLVNITAFKNALQDLKTLVFNV